MPRPKHILLHTWERLKIFIWRAGKFIVPMVLVLGVLNTIDTKGNIGNEDSENSLLSVVGKAITPVFEPIGVEKDNWQASVSIFTGLFAKEAVIGTLNGLYGQDDAAGEDAAAQADGYSLIGGLKAAFKSIPEALSEVPAAILDPLGFSGTGEDVSESDRNTVNALRTHFTKGFHQAFAFLLFVLLYVPYLAATGVVFREIGKGYGIVFVAYLTVVGWSIATLYNAVMVTQSAMWAFVGAGVLAAMFGGFWLYGRKHKINMV